MRNREPEDEEIQELTQPKRGRRRRAATWHDWVCGDVSPAEAYLLWEQGEDVGNVPDNVMRATDFALWQEWNSGLMPNTVYVTAQRAPLRKMAPAIPYVQSFIVCIEDLRSYKDGLRQAGWTVLLIQTEPM